uniref:Aminotransferase-like plant mobile domain-containing protein n=1 Tax=Oryza sativa subsp. japonica TaxID=39947 RepID=Q6EQ30_ORYSJ|nr:hypothetical protein [Oryza sativa Japonica Group]
MKHGQQRAGADRRAPLVSGTRGKHTVDSIHRGRGGTVDPDHGSGPRDRRPGSAQSRSNGHGRRGWGKARLKAGRPNDGARRRGHPRRWPATAHAGESGARERAAARRGKGEVATGCPAPSATARARSAERGGSDPVGWPPAAAARREDAREAADEGEEKGEGGECSPRCTTAKGRPTARNGGGGAPQEDDATELRRRASLGMGRTGSASIGHRGRRSSDGFPAKRGGSRGPPRPCGAEGGNGAGRRRPKRRRDAAGVGGGGESAETEAAAEARGWRTPASGGDGDRRGESGEKRRELGVEWETKEGSTRVLYIGLGDGDRARERRDRPATWGGEVELGMATVFAGRGGNGADVGGDRAHACAGEGTARGRRRRGEHGAAMAAVVPGVRKGMGLTSKSEGPWVDEIETLLGVTPGKQFKEMPENATKEQIEHYTRAFILDILGSMIFPDTLGDGVTAMYLQFLQDLDKPKEYNWGAATLAVLYRQLSFGAE